MKDSDRIQKVEDGYEYMPDGDGSREWIFPTLYRLADHLVTCRGYSQDEALDAIKAYRREHEPKNEWWG